MFGTAVYFGFDPGLVHLLADVFYNALDKFLALAFPEGDLFHEVVINLGLQIFQGKVIQLHLDF